MFVGAGTVLNIIAIIVGGAIGVALGGRFKENLRNLITQVLGCATFISAADADMVSRYDVIGIQT